MLNFRVLDSIFECTCSVSVTELERELRIISQRVLSSPPRSIMISPCSSRTWFDAVKLVLWLNLSLSVSMNPFRQTLSIRPFVAGAPWPLTTFSTSPVTFSTLLTHSMPYSNFVRVSLGVISESSRSNVRALEIPCKGVLISCEKCEIKAVSSFWVPDLEATVL